MAANLLLNPSFETATAGAPANWTLVKTTSGTPTLSDGVTAKYGLRSQRMNYTSESDASKLAYLISDSTPVGSFAPGEPATFGIDCYGTRVGVDSRVYIQARNSANIILGEAPVAFTLSAGYARKTVTYASLPANTSRCSVSVIALAIDTGDSFDITIDGAKLEKSATATPFPPPPDYNRLGD